MSMYDCAVCGEPKCEHVIDDAYNLNKANKYTLKINSELKARIKDLEEENKLLQKRLDDYAEYLKNK